MAKETRAFYTKHVGSNLESLATVASSQNPDGTPYLLPASEPRNTWSITITADNAAATVQRAAVAGQSHFITSISGSFSAPNAGKLMTLKDGVTVIGNFHIHNQRDVQFPEPIKLTVNTLAELSLAASGTALQIGAVTMTGFTL